MLRIGIECENLEDAKSRWGVGHTVLKLIESYTQNSELQSKFQLILYFKSFVPDDRALKHPSLIKKVVKTPLNSFNLYYHIFLPLRAMRDNLDYMFFPAYMLPPLYLKKSVVMLTNDVYYEYTKGSLPFRYRLAYGLFTNWAAIKATKILAISESSKSEVARLYKINPAKIFVSHLGIDTFREEIRNSQFEIPNSYILYVGQMFPRRRAKETILAFEKLLTDNRGRWPELKLILIGRDKYSPHIIKGLVKEVNARLGSERIIYHDYIEKDDDLSKLYAQARLLVYVSSNEAFGLPPMEAAKRKVPVVLTDNKLSHELIGNAAFFTDLSEDKNIEIANLTKAIERGLTDEAHRQYCITEYEKLPQRFSWSKFTNEFFKNLN